MSGAIGYSAAYSAWSAEEDAVLIRSVEAGLSVPAMLHALPGRSDSAARQRIGYLGARKTVFTARREAVLRARWGKYTTRSIASEMRVHCSLVDFWAARLGLGPNLHVPMRDLAGAVPQPPDKPRGFRPEAVAWARGAGREPEALLILGLAGLLPGLPKCEAAKGIAR